MATMAYTGPAGVTLTRDECLVLWALLERNACAENASIRAKLKAYLEREPDTSHVTIGHTYTDPA